MRPTPIHPETAPEVFLAPHTTATLKTRQPAANRATQTRLIGSNTRTGAKAGEALCQEEEATKATGTVASGPLQAGGPKGQDGMAQEAGTV